MATFEADDFTREEILQDCMALDDAIEEERRSYQERSTEEWEDLASATIREDSSC